MEMEVRLLHSSKAEPDTLVTDDGRLMDPRAEQP